MNEKPSTNEMIILILEGLERKIDNLANKMDQRFEHLKCNDQNIRIDRLEQREQGRKENKALIWAGLFTAVGAFGLSLWQWVKSQ